MKTSNSFFKHLSIIAMVSLTHLTMAQSGTENYKIQAGDTLAMNIFQEPDMLLEARVSVEGEVHFPLLGNVTVAGKSLPELQKTLFALYDADYFVNPQISLNIASYAPQRVRVRGKVNKPGFVVIPSEEVFTLLDVIAAAGDIAPGGNDKKIELQRTGSDGKPKVHLIDLTQEGPNNDPANIVLKAGDIVVVPDKLF